MDAKKAKWIEQSAVMQDFRVLANLGDDLLNLNAWLAIQGMRTDRAGDLAKLQR